MAFFAFILSLINSEQFYNLILNISVWNPVPGFKLIISIRSLLEEPLDLGFHKNQSLVHLASKRPSKQIILIPDSLYAPRIGNTRFSIPQFRLKNYR